MIDDGRLRPATTDHNGPNSPESKLLGAPILKNPEKAKDASPITYVSKDDPPFLIIHGDKDMTVPFDQSVQADEGRLRRRAWTSCSSRSRAAATVASATRNSPDGPAQFFDKHLRDQGVGTISEEPVPNAPPAAGR